MFDPSLRTPVVYAIAVRYQTPLWRAGAMLRAGCMAGFWVLLLWFPHDTWPKDAAMLALGTIGAVTAWAHNRSSLLDFLVARHIVGLSAAATSGLRSRAGSAASPASSARQSAQPARCRTTASRSAGAMAPVRYTPSWDRIPAHSPEPYM